ncbi:MAG: PIN domain-containing protein [Draconibacterium sp.]
MKDKFFIDTNIIVYAFDKRDVEKSQKAQGLIKLAHKGEGCISFQVVQEFLNVALKKFEVPLTPDDGKIYLSKILYPLCEVFPSESLYFNAIEIMERWRFSFYDSLIIAAAIDSDCRILYSEDLKHNQKIYELTIRNPFL